MVWVHIIVTHCVIVWVHIIVTGDTVQISEFRYSTDVVMGPPVLAASGSSTDISSAAKSGTRARRCGCSGRASAGRWWTAGCVGSTRSLLPQKPSPRIRLCGGRCLPPNSGGIARVMPIFCLGTWYLTNREETFSHGSPVVWGMCGVPVLHTFLHPQHLFMSTHWLKMADNHPKWNLVQGGLK